MLTASSSVISRPTICSGVGNLLRLEGAGSGSLLGMGPVVPWALADPGRLVRPAASARASRTKAVFRAVMQSLLAMRRPPALWPATRSADGSGPSGCTGLLYGLRAPRSAKMTPRWRARVQEASVPTRIDLAARVRPSLYE